MKKKKLLLPLAVMTLSCGLAAGVLTGCGGHEHVYTDYDFDESGHWQICAEDGATTEKVSHIFGDDGKCVCGAEKSAYGTASGNVKLLKLGEYTNDFTGVMIDAGEDDGIEIDYDTHTGAFTVKNAQIGKIYKLSITKSGYLTSYVNLQAVKDQNVALGDCVLQYDAFTHGSHTGSDWNGNYGTPSKIDKSNVNDVENPYFSIGDGTGDFYVYTNDTYDTVSAAVTYKDGLTWGVADGEAGNQAIHLVFEDGKASMIRIEKLADGTFKAQWIGGNNWEESCILGDWDFGEGEEHFKPFSEALTAQYKETGVELKLVRNGSVVYAYVNGEKAGEQILPEEYATQKCRVAFAAAHVNGGQQIPFSISDTLPESVFDSALTLETGTLPDGVTVSLDKEDGYKKGDLVTLTVNLPQNGDCSVTAINLGTASLLDRLENGKVSFLLTEETNTLTVTVKEIECVNLTDVSVIGKKYDVMGNSIADGTTVKLVGQGGLEDLEITVTEGKFSKTRVAQGSYTAELVGYKPAQVIVGANGIEGGITLEYDGFTFLENFDTAAHDFTNVNAENSSVKFTGNSGTLNILTKDSYTDVSASLRIKYNNSSNNMHTQGIVLKFEDGTHLIIRYHNGDQANGNIQYVNSAWGGCPADKTLFGADAGLNQWGEAPIHTLLDAETTAIKADGLYLTCVLKGGKLYTFFNEQWLATYNLPQGYEAKKVQIGFFTWDTVQNAVMDFKITKTLPSLAGTVELTKNVPDDAQGVEIAMDKTACSLGETVTLTVTLPAGGFVISEITLNGESVLSQLQNGSFSFNVTQAENTVVVTVLGRQLADVEVSVTGKKYDVKGNSLEGKEITLKGQGGLNNVTAKVEKGKIVVKDVVQGNYTAQAAGYKSVEVTVGANGIKTPIVFEYDGFTFLENFDTAAHDFTNVNAENSSVKFTGNSGTLNILTKDSYTDVSASMLIQYNNSSYSMHTQGIVLKFEDGTHLIIRYHNGDQANGNIQYVNSAWGGCPADKTLFGADAGLNQWGEAPIHTLLDAETTAIKADGLYLTCVLKGGKLYTFFDGNWVATYNLPQGYAGKKVQIGFFTFDTVKNAVTTFKITKTLPSLTGTVELTKNIPENAQGVEIAIDKTVCSFGETATLTVTLSAEGFVISEITLNGESVLSQLQNGSFSFNVTQAENTVVVTVVEGRVADVAVSVTGKKYDVTGNSLEGKEITLVGQGGLEDITVNVTNGMITKEGVAQGSYTAQVEGYKSVEVTVGANGIESPIVFEYEEAFDLVQGWGNKNLDQQNDGYLKGSNEMETLLTKALYHNVAFTLYLSGSYSDGKISGKNVQGIAVRFDGGGYVLLRMEIGDNFRKIQFAEPETWWQIDGKADGAGWDDLIFFQDNDEYLQAYAAGTLKLTLVREGATFYAFLNDQYIGSQTVDGKYENVGAHVGIYWAGTTNGAEKIWKFEMSETLPNLSAAITNGTTANGTVALSSQAPKYGDTVTVTLTPNAGYTLKSLTVGGKDVTDSVTFDENKVGTYTFLATVNVEVVAVFDSATYGNIDTEISGLKGTETIVLSGLEVTLSNAQANYEITVVDGKLTQTNVLTGEYTLTAEGYVVTTVTVTENGIADAIVLVYNIFTSAPDAADLSKLNEGKVIATGNGGVDLETKEKYINVIAEAHFDVPDYTGRRYSIALVFPDGKNFRVDFCVLDGGSNNILQQTNWGSMMFNWEWVDFPADYFAAGTNSYTEAEIRSEFIAKGLTFKLEREGATVNLYINGVLMKTYTLPDAYASQEAQLKFIFDSNGTDGTKGFTFDITVPEESKS